MISVCLKVSYVLDISRCTSELFNKRVSVANEFGWIIHDVTEWNIWFIQRGIYGQFYQFWLKCIVNLAIPIQIHWYVCCGNSACSTSHDKHDSPGSEITRKTNHSENNRKGDRQIHQVVSEMWKGDLFESLPQGEEISKVVSLVLTDSFRIVAFSWKKKESDFCSDPFWPILKAQNLIHN